MTKRHWIGVAGAILLSCQISLAQESGKIDLDLTSSARTLTPGSMADSAPITIMEGANSITVLADTLLTPAERLAVYQVFSTNTQTIQLAENGTAVGGSFVIGPRFSNFVGSLTIPNGVTAIKDFGHNSVLDLMGNFNNAGTFYAVSSLPGVQSATISASNITNLTTGLISSVLPVDSFFSSFQSNLSLSLVAANNLVNMGVIQSSGNLDISAGGNIMNTAQSAGLISSLMNQQGSPIMSAMNSLSLYSATGLIRNEGIISSLQGSVNAATGPSILESLSPSLHNLLDIDNRNGLITAVLGDIIFSNSTGDISLFAGELKSNNTNFHALKEVRSSMSVFNGSVINIDAGAAFIDSFGPSLVFGDVCLSGDPTFYNTTGNLVLSGTMTASDPIYLYSVGQILLNNSTIEAPLVVMVSGQLFYPPTPDGMGDPAPFGASAFRTEQIVVPANLPSGLPGDITVSNSEIKANVIEVRGSNAHIDFSNSKLTAPTITIVGENKITLPTVTTTNLGLLAPEVVLTGDVTAINLQIYSGPSSIYLDNRGTISGSLSFAGPTSILGIGGGGTFGDASIHADTVNFGDLNITDGSNFFVNSRTVNFGGTMNVQAAVTFGLLTDELKIGSLGQLTVSSSLVANKSIEVLGSLHFKNSASSSALSVVNGELINKGTISTNGMSSILATTVSNSGTLLNDGNSSFLVQASKNFTNTGSLLGKSPTGNVAVISNEVLLDGGTKLSFAHLQSQTAVSLVGNQSWDNADIQAPSVINLAGSTLSLKSGTMSSLRVDEFSNFGNLSVDGAGNASLQLQPSFLTANRDLTISGDFTNATGLNLNVVNFSSATFGTSNYNVNSFFVQDLLGGSAILPANVKAKDQISVATSKLELPNNASYSVSSGFLFLGLAPDIDVTIPSTSELNAKMGIVIRGKDISVGGTLRSEKAVLVEGKNIVVNSGTSVMSNDIHLLASKGLLISSASVRTDMKNPPLYGQTGSRIQSGATLSMDNTLLAIGNKLDMTAPVVQLNTLEVQGQGQIDIQGIVNGTVFGADALEYSYSTGTVNGLTDSPISVLGTALIQNSSSIQVKSNSSLFGNALLSDTFNPNQSEASAKSSPMVTESISLPFRNLAPSLSPDSTISPLDQVSGLYTVMTGAEELLSYVYNSAEAAESVVAPERFVKAYKEAMDDRITELLLAWGPLYDKLHANEDLDYKEKQDYTNINYELKELRGLKSDPDRLMARINEEYKHQLRYDLYLKKTRAAVSRESKTSEAQLWKLSENVTTRISDAFEKLQNKIENTDIVKGFKQAKDSLKKLTSPNPKNFDLRINYEDNPTGFKAVSFEQEEARSKQTLSNFFLIEGGEKESKFSFEDFEFFAKDKCLIGVLIEDDSVNFLNFCDDTLKENVYALVKGRKIVIGPGQQIMFSASHKFGKSSKPKELFVRRWDNVYKGDYCVAVSDFAMAPFLSLSPIRALRTSGDEKHRKVSARLLKSAAAVSIVGAKHGAYSK
ncbi:MAG: hypothetical protein K2X77_25265 [Candidatus Obscuribacterales bacterium]|jgi:hypothetical protein|nr:hypothetical protein [Candidatus Obscuribacterales bacterium]